MDLDSFTYYDKQISLLDNWIDYELKRKNREKAKKIYNAMSRMVQAHYDYAFDVLWAND
jgi:predicted nucleotidyltransferase